MKSNALRFTVGLLVTIGAIAIACALDAKVANASRTDGSEEFLRAHAVLRETLKLPGFFLFTLIVVAIVTWKHRAQFHAGLFVFVSTALSGVNQLIKWVAGRTRPFKPPDGSGRLVPFELHPFTNQGKNLCFPSGHASLAFATAAALAILWPRFRWAFYALATIVAIERIAENAHWLSDVVAGAALGIGVAHLTRVIWWDRRRMPL